MTTRVQLLESINYKEKTWASKLSKVNRASARERGVRKRRRKLRRDQLLPLIACSPRACSQALSNHRESRPARAARLRLKPRAYKYFSMVPVSVLLGTAPITVSTF